MSLIFAFFMAIGGVVMCFTGELLYGIILYAICGFCLVGTDISLALKGDGKVIGSGKKDFDVKSTTELMKEMNKLMDILDRDKES